MNHSLVAQYENEGASKGGCCPEPREVGEYETSSLRTTGLLPDLGQAEELSV